MPKYVPLDQFPSDKWRTWRRVQCPNCQRGFEARIRITSARCRCGTEMKVLTAADRAAPAFREAGRKALAEYRQSIREARKLSGKPL